MQGPARDIILKCGKPPTKVPVVAAAEIVAGWCGLATSTVLSWTYAADKGGAGGFIPHRYHRVILDSAQAAGIELTEADFFRLKDN